MTSFMLCHAHDRAECPVVFAAFNGFASALGAAACSCRTGGHRMWWRVEAADSVAALAHLPDFVAARTEAFEVREVSPSG